MESCWFIKQLTAYTILIKLNRQRPHTFLDTFNLSFSIHSQFRLLLLLLPRYCCCGGTTYAKSHAVLLTYSNWITDFMYIFLYYSNIAPHSSPNTFLTLLTCPTSARSLFFSAVASAIRRSISLTRSKLLLICLRMLCVCLFVFMRVFVCVKVK